MSKHHKSQLGSAALDALTLEDGVLFHTGKGTPVELPQASAPLADTHGHLTHFHGHDPAMALARAAVAGVRLLVVPLDPVGDARDAQATLDELSRWQEQMTFALAELKERAGLEPQGAQVVTPAGTMLNWPLDLRIVGGAHPYGAERLDATALAQLDVLLSDPRCVGVGEFGIDVGPWSRVPLEPQEEAMRLQLRIAHEHGLPVELHLRDEEDGVHTTAHDVAARLLAEEGVPEAGCDLHCYTSDEVVMEPFIEMGCHIAFGGASTFATNDHIRAAALACPAERLLSETDSPYMAPVPLRRQECEPAMVALTASRIAELRAEAGLADPSATYTALWTNALQFFGL